MNQHYIDNKKTQISSSAERVEMKRIRSTIAVPCRHDEVKIRRTRIEKTLNFIFPFSRLFSCVWEREDGEFVSGTETNLMRGLSNVSN